MVINSAFKIVYFFIRNDQPRTSTPNTADVPFIQGKHKLTPLSTKGVESPKQKRFRAGKLKFDCAHT